MTESPQPLKPARTRVRVEYEDGHSETFNPNKPKYLLAMERKFKVQEPETHEELYWLAWHALGGDDLGPFDKWVDTVEYVIPEDVDGGGDGAGEGPPS
jgi:hypothetical protein